MGKASIDLLIFDLDGTLIESKWDIAASVNFTLEELGLPQRPLEEIFGFVGDGVKKLLRLAVGETNRVSFEEALGVFRRHYLAHCLDRTVYYPGVEKVLGYFGDKRKAVTTNKSIEYTNVILQGLGPQHFQFVVGGDNGFGLKPECVKAPRLSPNTFVPSNSVINPFVYLALTRLQNRRSARISVLLPSKVVS